MRRSLLLLYFFLVIISSYNSEIQRISGVNRMNGSFQFDIFPVVSHPNDKKNVFTAQQVLSVSTQTLTFITFIFYIVEQTRKNRKYRHINVLN